MIRDKKMDIFTTQLTRVVQTPIKPANLKVKALLKEAGAGKLKEDLDHLENHDYYFPQEKHADEESNLEYNQQGRQESHHAGAQEKRKERKITPTDDETLNKDKEGLDKDNHLDLYV